MGWVFNTLFKKRIIELKKQEQEYYAKIRSLRQENDTIKEELEKEKIKNERILFLVNDKAKWSDKIIIEKTHKGVLVMLLIKNFPFEIWMYDIDNSDIYERNSLLVYTTPMSDFLFIKDIQGGNSFGHGTLAMKYIIEHAKEKKYTSIKGKLSKTDIDHKERLFYFYKKHGFTIELENSGLDFGSIIKILE